MIYFKETKNKELVPLREVYKTLMEDNEYPDSDKCNLLVKGEIIFGYIDGKIQHFKREYEPKEARSFCGDLMTGREFYADVDYGGIIDYDGILGDVYVDGYLSNLGLAHKGLCQGNFIVDGKTWIELCNDYEIVVEWYNK